MCQVSVFGDLNTTSFLQFCTASVCVHYLWWTHSWHDVLENWAHLLILGLFFCFWKVGLIKTPILFNRVEERRLQCVPSVERFSSRVSSSHFYTCRSFHQTVDSQSYIFKEHNQKSVMNVLNRQRGRWPPSLGEVSRWKSLPHPEAGGSFIPVFQSDEFLQKCVTAAENKISAIDGKALGMNFQLGSLYDAR